MALLHYSKTARAAKHCCFCRAGGLSAFSFYAGGDGYTTSLSSALIRGR